MKPVDIIALLVMLGVLAASLGGFFDDEKTAPPRNDQQRRPAPDGPALPQPSRNDPVVMIDDEGPAGNSIGTAFSLDSDGVWMTARHVVEGCTKVGILTGPKRATRVRDIWIHPEADIAILSNTASRPALSVAGRLPAIGESGYGVGFPQGNPGEVAGRLIGRAVSISRSRADVREPILTWAETARYPDFDGSLGGISGGPLLIEDGRVAGVVISGSPRRGRFNSAAPRSLEPALASAALSVDADDAHFKFHEPLNAATIDSLGDKLRDSGTVSLVVCLVDPSG